MKRPDPLIVKLLSLTAFVSLIGVLATAAITSVFMAQYQANSTFRDRPTEIQRAFRQCSGEPIQRGVRLIEFFDPLTYDPTSASSQPLSPTVVEHLDAGKRRVLRRGLWLGAGTEVTRLVRPASPCGVVRVTITAAPVLRPSSLRFLGIVSALIPFISCLAAYILTLRPLLARVRRTRDAAAAVGTLAFETAHVEDWSDLGSIHQALRETDHRIKSDAETLAARAETIESMLHTVAHDLKTPLATLQLNLQNAMEDLSGPEGQSALARAFAETQYATTLLENLEITAKIQASALEPSEEITDLSAIVAQAVTRFAVLGEHKTMEVAGSWPDGPVSVMANSTIVLRIVSNLLHNSVRHGNTGGHVAVILERVAENFHLSIRDDGSGFPETVLQGFSSLIIPKTGPTRIKGAGLGLAIVKHLCEQLGWTIELANTEDGGAIVCIGGPVQQVS